MSVYIIPGTKLHKKIHIYKKKNHFLSSKWAKSCVERAEFWHTALKSTVFCQKVTG